jgi:hypothetical protein
MKNTPAKASKKRDGIIYFGIFAVIILAIFAYQYFPTSDECPRPGEPFYIAGALSLIIFIVGKSISLMATKGIKGWIVAVTSAVLTLFLLFLGALIGFYMYFCLI